jgi:Tfp pilus assembly protein PilZ
LACYRGSTDLGANLAVSLLDVSETGALLVLRAYLEAGQEVTLLLEGQGHLRPIRLLGKVAWCTPQTEKTPSETFRAGIVFDKHLTWADLMHLC